MKLILNLCGIAVAGILGYSFEPNLRGFLTGQEAGKPEVTANSRVIIKAGPGAEEVDLQSLSPEQLPEVIRISTALQVEDSATGITMNIPAGNNVKLVSIDGAMVEVSHGGSYHGRISVMDTDLLQRLAEMPSISSPAAPAAVTPEPEAPTADEPAEPAAMPEAEPAPLPTQPESAPFGEPATPADSAPEPVTPAESAPEPTTPPESAGQPAAAAGGGDVVPVMQASVKSGQIKEFTFDQVTEWKAGEPEDFEGENYQTGTALYKAVTFLGEKSIEAKAFIKDGKVQRWIWPRSGMEIK